MVIGRHSASNVCDETIGRNMTIGYGVILVVIGCSILFSYGEGWGADWKFVKKNSEGSVLEIDVASISRQPNNIVRAWLKLSHTKESVAEWVKQLGEDYKDFSYSIYSAEYDCTERKSRILSRIHYSSDGRIIFSENSPGEWTILTSSSLGDSVFKEVCEQPK